MVLPISPTDAQWSRIRPFFPADLSALAKQSKSVKRFRNVSSGDDLLRLCLMYAVNTLSLRSTACCATAANIPLADTAVLKRLCKAPPFLQAVLAHVLEKGAHAADAGVSRLRVTDATTVEVPGADGTSWRVHAVYDAVAGRLQGVEITDEKGGETLCRNQVERGEWIFADNGLARAAGIHHASEGGAFVLVRAHLQNLRMLTKDGQVLNPSQVMRRARAGQVEMRVLVPYQGRNVEARLLVRPLPPKQASAQRRRRAAHKKDKGRRCGRLGQQLRGYLCLLTTLPADRVPANAVFAMYRLRWQVELFFKRCKSLLQLHQLAADDPNLVRTYLLTKMIEVALLDRLAEPEQVFSPMPHAA
jgi:hypothetical protein